MNFVVIVEVLPTVVEQYIEREGEPTQKSDSWIVLSHDHAARLSLFLMVGNDFNIWSQLLAIKCEENILLERAEATTNTVAILKFLQIAKSIVFSRVKKLLAILMNLQFL